MNDHTRAALALLALGATVAACGPRMQPPRPLMDNGAFIRSDADETVALAHAQAQAEQARMAEARAQTEAAALASCSAAVCDAIARGELAVGMTEAQVLAATRTTAGAWEGRGAARLRTLSAAHADHEPADAVGPVAYVQLQDGRVRAYAYREPQGLRLVSSAADASPEGTARVRAAALRREGDELALTGRFTQALDRYDRADVVQPGNPETTLRIARALDKLLRPVEARLRYELFLHQLEMERIRTTGEAYGHLATAIAEAQQRIVVLDRRR